MENILTFGGNEYINSCVYQMIGTGNNICVLHVHVWAALLTWIGINPRKVMTFIDHIFVFFYLLALVSFIINYI